MKNNEKIKKIKLANSILGGGIKNKNAFTLIELLAIIVILAIITVITVPIILNVIDNAKKGSIKDSAYGYKDAVNKYYVSELYDNGNLKLNGDYTITDKGELSDGTNTYPIQVSGTTPTGGNLAYENNVLKNGCITIYEYKATIENGEVTTVEKGACETPKPICIRATKLHEEVCEPGPCASTYSIGGIIKYGEIRTKGNDLVSGDAFDCDVNGDKNYDQETERFYYVSDLFDSTIEGDDKFNHDVAVLVYYNNTTSGVPNNSGFVAYDSENKNYNGPSTAITSLPTKIQWNNVNLTNTNRKILNEIGTAKSNNALNELPIFSYDGYNARLLMTQELEEACKIKIGKETIV